MFLLVLTCNFLNTLLLPTLIFLRQALLHQHQFSSLFTEFSPLILVAGDEIKLSCHYQLWSINLKEKKEETPTQGSPSQQTFTDKESTHTSDTSAAPSVCSRPEDLSLQEGTHGCQSWVSMDPPRAAFRQSFACEGWWKLLFSRNLPQKMGWFKGCFQKPTLSWRWERRSVCAFTRVWGELCCRGGWFSGPGTAVSPGFLALMLQLDWYLLLPLEFDVNLKKKKSEGGMILVRAGSNAGEGLTSQPGSRAVMPWWVLCPGWISDRLLVSSAGKSWNKYSRFSGGVSTEEHYPHEES